MAASTRRGSINQALARRVADQLGGAGESIGLVDLADYQIPLYNGDIEARDGIPPTATELAARIAEAEVLVIVTPEYNGTFTPLLKNTIDWLTWVDIAVLAHLHVLLASASPGRGGGVKAVAMIRDWMSNIGVDVAERSLSVGSAGLGPDGSIVGVADRDIAEFVDQVPKASCRVAS